jgi:hypothetical protein
MYTSVFIIKLNLINAYAIFFLLKCSICYIPSFLKLNVNLIKMNINVFLNYNLIRITRNVMINA